MAAVIPNVSISPSQVPQGTPLTVTLTNGVPGRQYILAFHTNVPIAVTQNPGIVTTNNNGNAIWSANILADAVIRTYILSVHDGSTGSVVTQVNVPVIAALPPPVQYDREVTLLDSSGNTLSNGSIVDVGEEISVALFDWPPNTTVRVQRDGVTITTVSTAFNGAGEATFKLFSQGTFTINFRETQSTTDYRPISITAQAGSTNEPPTGDIDPMLIVAGLIVAGGAAFALSGGLKKLPKIL
jgi:hypothetical protein